MAKEIEVLDNAQCQEKLAKILESGPLYSEYRYQGPNVHQLPTVIERYCVQCLRETQWLHVINRNQTGSDRGEYLQRIFRCANCNKQTVYFSYIWRNSTENVEGQQVTVYSFIKYGQFPPLEERLSKELERALQATDDLEFYKTALRFRNFGKGIGAMAYMRRIVESHMSDMLEILNAEAKANNLEPMTKEDISNLRFSEKVERAKELFPAIIKPEHYPNPFEQLYKLTSDAVHNLSEADSVILFDQCRIVFEYVFSEMRPHLKRHKEFLEGLQKLPKLSAAAMRQGE